MNESEVVLSRSVKLEANPFRPKRDARSKDDDGLALLYSSVDSLSPQMQRVLSLLVEGHSNKEIAWRLSLKEATIKSHMSVIMKALGCRNRTQAALVAFCLASNLKPQLAKLRTSIGPRGGPIDGRPAADFSCSRGISVRPVRFEGGTASKRRT